MQKLKLVVLLSSLIFAGSAFADPDIHHPNLKDAYRACNESIRHIDIAQANNQGHGEFGGHAERAKELLAKAKREIEEADHFRDAHMHQ